MTADPSYITLLKQEYDAYYENAYHDNDSVIVKEHSCIDRYIGSETAISLIGHDLLCLNAPGCIAAPTVNFVVKNQISLGMQGRNGEHLPARLFAENLLTITTPYLEVGVVEFFNPSTLEGAIFCNTLSLYKPLGEPDPECFEILESMVIREATEVQKFAVITFSNRGSSDEAFL